MKCDAVQDNPKPAGGNSDASPSCIATLAGFFIGDNMKKIPLTQGKFALVDDADFELASRFKWHVLKNGNRRYAQCSMYMGVLSKKSVNCYMLLHRLILRPNPDMEIDHIDNNGLDCRRDNIRTCTHAQNNYNRTPQGQTSQYKGVYKQCLKWCSKIKKNGVSKNLGCYLDEKEAAIAYDKAAKELFGEYAFTNF